MSLPQTGIPTSGSPEFWVPAFSAVFPTVLCRMDLSTRSFNVVLWTISTLLCRPYSRIVMALKLACHSLKSEILVLVVFFSFSLGACFSYYSPCSSRNVLSQLWHIGTRRAYYQSWPRKHRVPRACAGGVSDLPLWSVKMDMFQMLIEGRGSEWYFNLAYLYWHLQIHMQSSSFRFPLLCLEKK